MENIMTTAIDINKIVEEANGDLEALFSTLLKANDGDITKTNDIIDQLLDEEEQKLADAMKEIEEGKQFKVVSDNLVETREQQARDTQREYFKELYFTGSGRKEADPVEAWNAYYSTHPTEAAEDGIKPVS